MILTLGFILTANHILTHYSAMSWLCSPIKYFRNSLFLHIEFGVKQTLKENNLNL